MPGDEYSAAVSGGLKLKGVNSSSKISKHKKKKKAKEPNAEADNSAAIAEKREHKTSQSPERERSNDALDENAIKKSTDAVAPLSPQPSTKTEAELRHEERRRKRLDERLKREGTKTHKERVEELNRYLSNLSEHHDMPRIGPG